MKFERLHVVSSMLAAAVAVPTAVFSYWRLNQLTSPVPHMHICNTVYETEDKTGKRTRKPRLHIDFGNAGSASMNVLSLQMFVNGQPATTWQTVIGNGKSHGVPWLPLLPFEPPIVSWTSDWRYFAPNEYTNVACIVPVDGSVDDSYEGAAKWTKDAHKQLLQDRHIEYVVTYSKHPVHIFGWRVPWSADTETVRQTLQ